MGRDFHAPRGPNKALFKNKKAIDLLECPSSASPAPAPTTTTTTSSSKARKKVSDVSALFNRNFQAMEFLKDFESFVSAEVEFDHHKDAKNGDADDSESTSLKNYASAMKEDLIKNYASAMKEDLIKKYASIHDVAAPQTGDMVFQLGEPITVEEILAKKNAAGEVTVSTIPKTPVIVNPRSALASGVRKKKAAPKKLTFKEGEKGDGKKKDKEISKLSKEDCRTLLISNFLEGYVDYRVAQVNSPTPPTPPTIVAGSSVDSQPVAATDVAALTTNPVKLSANDTDPYDLHAKGVKLALNLHVRNAEADALTHKLNARKAEMTNILYSLAVLKMGGWYHDTDDESDEDKHEEPVQTQEEGQHCSAAAVDWLYDEIFGILGVEE